MGKQRIHMDIKIRNVTTLLQNKTKTKVKQKGEKERTEKKEYDGYKTVVVKSNIMTGSFRVAGIIITFYFHSSSPPPPRSAHLARHSSTESVAAESGARRIVSDEKLL